VEIDNASFLDRIREEGWRLLPAGSLASLSLEGHQSGASLPTSSPPTWSPLFPAGADGQHRKTESTIHQNRAFSRKPRDTFFSRSVSFMASFGQAVTVTRESFDKESTATLAFILLFIYTLAADPMYIGGPPTLFLQSASFLIASLLGYLSLRCAIHAGLTPSASRTTAQRMARIGLSNPLTATIATASPWSGLTIWTLSWFIFWPLLSVLLARRGPE